MRQIEFPFILLMLLQANVQMQAEDCCKRIKFFEMTGIHGATLREQLGNFSLALGEAIKSKTPVPTSVNWQQAFHELNTYLLDHLDPQQAVVFFLMSFHGYTHPGRIFYVPSIIGGIAPVSNIANLKVVICGSAA
jgi:hypothetical protein